MQPTSLEQIGGFRVRPEVLAELGVEVTTRAHVLEHALQLRGVVEAAGVLQTGDHHALRVLRDGQVEDQAAGQHVGVELLEHVLVLHVLEHVHLARVKLMISRHDKLGVFQISALNHVNWFSVRLSISWN